MKFLFFLAVLCGGSAQEAPACSAILNYIQETLPQSGVLKESEGFVYVDVDDAYIHKLILFIQQEGFEEPPYFGDGLVGAHISVMDPGEVEKYGVGKIQEFGERVDFVLKECHVVHPPQWREIDEVYFVAVEAPELDRIREKYGLPKKLYDFHITIGVKPKVAKSA